VYDIKLYMDQKCTSQVAVISRKERTLRSTAAGHRANCLSNCIFFPSYFVFKNENVKVKVKYGFVFRVEFTYFLHIKGNLSFHIYIAAKILLSYYVCRLIKGLKIYFVHNIYSILLVKIYLNQA
jgi:hypothetical protein